MNRSPLTSAVAIARALGHPARLRTVAMLISGDLCVCQITTVLGLAPSTVSAHLRELRHAGLITELKVGRWVHVMVADDPAVRPWIDNAVSAVSTDPRLLSDRRVVEELRKTPLEELSRLNLDGERLQQEAYDEGDTDEHTSSPPLTR